MFSVVFVKNLLPVQMIMFEHQLHVLEEISESIRGLFIMYFCILKTRNTWIIVLRNLRTNKRHAIGFPNGEYPSKHREDETFDVSNKHSQNFS